ncbi:MAG: hypothetical protein ACI4PE_01370 [Bacilli bacterium]
MKKISYGGFILVLLVCFAVLFSSTINYNDTNKTNISTNSKEMLEGLYENPSMKTMGLVKDVDPENVLFEQVFDTTEEAEKWLDEKENTLKEDYDIIDKKITELENQIISTEKVVVNESFDTEESAKERKEEIEKGDIENPSLSLQKKDAVIAIVKETFDTQEDALEFVKEYKEKYDTDLTVSEIYSNWVSNGTIKVKELSDLSEEERDKEVDRIIKEIEDESTDTIKYEVSFTKNSKTESVYVRDDVTEGSEKFDSLEEANKFISNLKISENDNVKFEINGPELNKVLISSETSKIEEVFDTMDEVNLYIQKLESEGYVLSDIVKDQVTEEQIEKVPTGKIIVNDSNKLDSSGRYEVNGNYLIIKQASGNVAVWTMEELTTTEQESFRASWFDKKGSDGSVSSDTNFEFIYGVGSHNLSYIGNGWGTYTISFDGNKIIMTCDKISHLYYGTYEKEYTEKVIEVITKYTLSGNKTINKYKDEYLVDYKRTEKLFEDKTTYGAEINKEEFIRDKKYQVNGSYESEKEVWILSGEYIQNNRGSLYLAMISAKLKEVNNDDEPNSDKEEVKPVFNKDVLRIEKAKNGAQLVEITPPYTGVNDSNDSNLIISLVVISVSTLLALPTRKILFD